MPKNMRGKYERLLAPFSVIFLMTTACGYSQDAWDQKVRRNGELREELAAEQRARAQAENDYADALEELERASQIRIEPVSPKAQEKKAFPEEVSPCSAEGLLLPQQRKLEDALAQKTNITWSLKESFPSVTLSLPLSQLFERGTAQVNEAAETFIISFLRAVVVPYNAYDISYSITPVIMQEEEKLKTRTVEDEQSLEIATGPLIKKSLNAEQMMRSWNLMLTRASQNIEHSQLKLAAPSKLETTISSQTSSSQFELHVVLKSNGKPALEDSSETQKLEQTSELKAPQP